MNHFFDGFYDEIEKLGGVASALGGKMGANAIAHWIMNTKFAPKALRRMFENAGDDMMAAGFRHAIQGRRLSPVTSAAIGTVISPSAIYMYNTGFKYGRKVHQTMRRIPLAGGRTPFKALRAADIGATAAAKAAPIAGAATGGTYGYLTGRTKKERLPIKSIAAGALTGGLLGKGVKHYAPQAPLLKQLKFVRTKVADPVIKGSQTRLGKLLDKETRPYKSKS
jgi:hypothetical protein